VSVQWLEYEKWPREYATVEEAARALSKKADEIEEAIKTSETLTVDVPIGYDRADTSEFASDWP